MKIRFTLLLLLVTTAVFAQKTLAPLTVEKIMRDQKWIGTSPSNPYWSADGRYLFFPGIRIRVLPILCITSQ